VPRQRQIAPMRQAGDHNALVGLNAIAIVKSTEVMIARPSKALKRGRTSPSLCSAIQEGRRTI
jgi:hypothetical protein